MKLNEEIKIARVKEGLTQYELAKKAYVTPTTIFLLEKNGRCNLTTLYKVCEALNLDFNTIYYTYKDRH